MTDIKEKIENEIQSHNITLFMKGNKDFPMCGFSAAVISILDKLGANYHTINVLDDNEIRAGIKEYSDWPTIPQLYINNEFIGGCDIVTEMFETGELHQLISQS